MIRAIAPPGYTEEDCLAIYKECDDDMNKVGEYVSRLWDSNEKLELNKTWKTVSARSEKVRHL